MNPIKDIMALKPAESLEVPVRLQDGSTRKLARRKLSGWNAAETDHD